MGDPLTKPILHLVNILVRDTAELLSNGNVSGLDAAAIQEVGMLRTKIISRRDRI